MGRNAWRSLFLSSALAAACTPGGGGGGGGGANPGNPPPASPAREFLGEPAAIPAGPPATGLTLVESVDFSGAAVPFADALSAAAMASGSFAPGQWAAGNGTYTQAELGPSTRLSIRRYTGAVGDRYRVEVSGWTYRVMTSDPARDQGVVVMMPFYQDERHYVIASNSPSMAEAWTCNGQGPGEGWPVANRLWSQGFATPRTVGMATTWTCDVEVPAHRMTIYLDGDRKATVTSALIDSTPHTVALASNGSQVRYASFKLYSLGAAGEGETPAPGPTRAPVLRPTPAPTPPPATRRPAPPTPTPAPADLPEPAL